MEATTADPDEAIRLQWGSNLSGLMSEHGMKPRHMVIALADQGVTVSPQAVGQWMSGTVAPKPSTMAAISRVLRVPPRTLFAIDASVDAA